MDRRHVLSRLDARLPARGVVPILQQILQRLDAGQGRDGDLELLVDLCENILGRSFCALGDGATSPITSGIKYFHNEFAAGMSTPSWELFPPAASARWQEVAK